jgi:hypothetical protein
MTCVEHSEVAPFSFASLLVISASQYPVLLLASLPFEVRFTLPLAVFAHLAYSPAASPLLLIGQFGDLWPDALQW